MADPRLFFEAPDGEEGTQVSIVAIGQGSTRQISTFITADDVVGLTPGIAPGDYNGQPAAWNADSSIWEGLPIGSPLVFRSWQSDAQCLVEPTTAFSVIAPEEIAFNAGSGAALLNMNSLAVLLESQSNIRLNAPTSGQFIELDSFGVSLTLSDLFSVSLGEGANSVFLDNTIGWTLTVEPGRTISQNSGGACFYTHTQGAHNFTVPNDDGTEEIQNVIFSSALNAPTVGFLGNGAVPRQSITGATTQDQVDSLVAALVAFGLVSDDR